MLTWKAAVVTKQTKYGLGYSQVTKACKIVLLKCNSRMALELFYFFPEMKENLHGLPKKAVSNSSL